MGRYHSERSAPLPSSASPPQTAIVDFVLRPYRPADFDRLWEIDQLCFPSGIAYNQMELSGFILRRNAITLVAEAQPAPESELVESPPTPQDNADNPTSKSQRSTAKGNRSSKRSGDVSATSDPRRIAGFVIGHPFRRIGRIITLDIIPQARRSGLASRLMHACEELLCHAGCGEIYLETAVDNQAAIRLYRKLGYEILQTLPEYYSVHGLDAFRMAKRLQPVH